jgi:hypothetical protein
MRDERNACNVWLENLAVDGKIILEWILEKECAKEGVDWLPYGSK